MIRRVYMAMAAVLLLWPVTVMAHSMQPAFVAVDVVDDTRATLTLKTPLLQGRAPVLSVQLDAPCEMTSRAAPQRLDDAIVDHLDVTCPDGFDTASLHIGGLDTGVNDAIVVLQHPGERPRTHVVEADAPSLALGRQVEAAASSANSHGIWAYLVLGIEHILLGIDHLLFVLGLLFVVWRRRVVHGDRSGSTLLGTITAFTVAHSITLGLAMLGHVKLSSGPVELVIALSIVLLALELTRHGEAAQTWTFRYPWLVAFAFGLLHGFGFAGALADIGLPDDALIPALVLFNLGVELGQLLFIAPLLGLALLVRHRSRKTTPTQLAWRLQWATSYVIGTLAMYWCFERGVQLWFP